MRVSHITTGLTTSALVFVFGATFILNSSSAAQQPSDTGLQGIEVLTRGPVHEAFAETVTFDPEPGIVIAKVPPESIEEVTPDQKPEGANVAWIPGYWGWDDERNDFLWVSGIWRALPPGRQWIPGYWALSGQNYQWTSGYWADAQANEIQYLPEPPATVEVGPNIAAPSTDSTWLPGCWVWQQTRYAWRPGSWVAGQQDWQWVPDYYVWTPRGYVFVDGYWDYSVGRRGVLFAPVYFNANVYSQRGFAYSPSTVINPAVFASHLFLRPSYGHYYFGDYYDANYANAGFSPWFSFQSSRSGYDPFFAHERWQHRQERDWENRTAESFRNYRNNESTRPPRTWAAQRALNANAPNTSATAANNRAVTLAAPLEELSKSKDSPFRFQAVDKAERQQLGSHRQESRKFLQQRQQLEANAANTSPANPAPTAGPATAKLPKSPFVATTGKQLSTQDGPPKRYEVLKPNLQVQPQPRKGGSQAKVNTGTSQAPDKNVPQGPPTAKVKNQTQGDSKGQPQGESKGQKQSGAKGQQEGRSKDQKKSGSSGQQQSGTGGQQQGPPQNPSKDDSKKKDRN